MVYRGILFSTTQEDTGMIKRKIPLKQIQQQIKEENTCGQLPWGWWYVIERGKVVSEPRTTRGVRKLWPRRARRSYDLSKGYSTIKLKGLGWVLPTINWRQHYSYTE